MQSKLEQLRDGVDPLTPIFILIDPLAGEPLPGIGVPDAGANMIVLRQQLWQRDVVQVRLAKTIVLPPHLHPYLVHLHGPDDPLLELSLEIADAERLATQIGGLDGEGRGTHKIGGWLQSSMQPEELADVISAMCQLDTDAYTKANYLRLVDRRVLDLLRHVVGDGRVAGQFGRLQNWTYLDSVGRLHRLRSLGEERSALRLSKVEWQRLQRGDMLHRTMAMWLGEVGLMSDAPSEQMYLVMEEAVMKAASAARKWPHRFETGADQIVWAVLTLLHPTLPHSHVVAKLLADPGSQDEPPEPLRYFYREVRVIAGREDTELTR